MASTGTTPWSHRENRVVGSENDRRISPVMCCLKHEVQLSKHCRTYSEIFDWSDYLQFADDPRQRTPREGAMRGTVFVPVQIS
jgi:hypothetical protein